MIIFVYIGNWLNLHMSSIRANWTVLCIACRDSNAKHNCFHTIHDTAFDSFEQPLVILDAAFFMNIPLNKQYKIGAPVLDVKSIHTYDYSRSVIRYAIFDRFLVTSEVWTKITRNKCIEPVNDSWYLNGLHSSCLVFSDVCTN